MGRLAYISLMVMHNALLTNYNVMPSGFFYFNPLNRFIAHIQCKGCLARFLFLSHFEEISELNVNSVDPDQIPRSAASDLGLHCLPMSLLRNVPLILVGPLRE